MKKRTNLYLYIICILMFACPILQSQIDASGLTGLTYQYLDKGDCEKAEKKSEQHINRGYSRNYDLERRIVESKPPKDLKSFHPYVFSMRMTKLIISCDQSSDAYEIIKDSYPDGCYEYFFRESEIPTATGFITNNGYFITARHVVEPWAYWANEDNSIFTLVNVLLQMGASIDAIIVAEGISGDHFVIHYTDFYVSRTNDRLINYDDNFSLYLAYGNDYAYSKINLKSKIMPNGQLSNNLSVNTPLEVLCFPSCAHKFQYTTTINYNNALLSVTGDNYEVCTGGSPVFCKDNDLYYLVGLVSSHVGRSSGGIIPISEVLSKKKLN